MINFFKSVLEQDPSPIVLCDLEDIIVYMNPAAKMRYHKELVGSNIKDCHPKDANKKIDQVLCWFKKSTDNNSVYTFYNEKENKDVYMIALRDDDKNLIGYYEKHAYRNRETTGLYEMSPSGERNVD